jgi:tRNA threonylcarbamoyladenosine biosynthesis protein TsaE
MVMEWMSRLYGITDLPEITKELAQIISQFRVVTFTGNLGAGKTTLIKMLCAHLGVKETVNSPTFSLVNQYSTEGAEVGDVLFHIDLYRLKNEEEAFDAGIEEHLFSGHLCLVEWPEKAIGIIPDNTLRVEITTQDHEQRHIRVVSGEN